MNINYQRVLPRDLFNEAKLLKCMGRLTLLIHDRQTPVKMDFEENGEPFIIDLMIDGSLTITNLKIFINGEKYLFKTTINCKSNYPLFLYRDLVEYLVFDEAGKFDNDFIEFCKTIN